MQLKFLFLIFFLAACDGGGGGSDSDPVVPTPVDPGPVDPGPVDPGPVDPGPVDPDPVEPDPVEPDPVEPDPVDPDPVDPDPVDPDPVDPDPVDPDPVDPDPVDPVALTIDIVVEGATDEIVVQNNGFDYLVIIENGVTYSFDVNDLDDYDITMLSAHPTGQTCIISNGTGTVNGSNVDVTVSCVNDTYLIGGRVFGLTGEGLTLQNNGGDDLVISSNGQFRFDTPLEYGETYSVAIVNQPENLDQTCSFKNDNRIATQFGTTEGRVRNIYIACVWKTIATVHNLEASTNYGHNNQITDGYEETHLKYHLYLTNGNFVIVDYTYSARVVNGGAAHLYDGATGEWINTIFGGTVDDHIGRDGVVALSNGNFVVISSQWNNVNDTVENAGAVTLVSGVDGKIIGGVDDSDIVSDTNSLHGGSADDQIGIEYIYFYYNNKKWIGDTNKQGDVRALTNGNYVVSSPFWDHGEIVDAGAVTLVDGLTGKAVIDGSLEVSILNSLHGTRKNDNVGLNEKGDVTGLANGNYVVKSGYWANEDLIKAGAVTLMNGLTGYPVEDELSSIIDLKITINNSLHGTQQGDHIGYTHWELELTNGNYVIVSSGWHNSSKVAVGAVTLVDGTSGRAFADQEFAVSSVNSLHGGTKGDGLGMEGMKELNNGHIAITGRQMDILTVVNAGASVLMHGGLDPTQAGRAVVNGEFLVNETNALHGTHAGDNVSFDRVFVLANGNYVVNSADWNGVANHAGASTVMDGESGFPVATPNSLEVSTSNSMYGTTANDWVAFTNHRTLVPLPDGNFALRNKNWSDFGIDELLTDDDVGAVGAITLVSGVTGSAVIDGSFQVSTANSLHGTQVDDHIGEGPLILLENGNYIVISPSWDNGNTGNVGAVTVVDGTTGMAIVDRELAVTDKNSLHGVTANDQIGFYHITIAAENYFLVTSPLWNNGDIVSLGALTLMSGVSGLAVDGELIVNTVNSIVGLSENDGRQMMNRAVYDPFNNNFFAVFEDYFVLVNLDH